MKRCALLLAAAAMVAFGETHAWAVDYSVVNTKHNLSLNGPGEIKSSSETRVCIFCHTPHHASTDARLDYRPLWSHEASSEWYDTYVPVNSKATSPGQPTGTSRLCLSCHDGSVAVGRLHGDYLLPGTTEETKIPTSSSAYIGSDLKNDHPVSFSYDSRLWSKGLELKDPSTLPAEIRLEKNTNFVQCTTCHDPHRDPSPPNSKFLVIDNYKKGSPLCLACHEKTGWSYNPHKLDESIAPDGCEICHKPHGAYGVNNIPLLQWKYDYSSKHAYDEPSYKLCLNATCHSASNLLDPLHPELTHFPKHYGHVVTREYPCLACHPDHGVSINDAGHLHLVEFSPIFGSGTYDSTNKSCTVTCHSTNPRSYASPPPP